MLSKVSRLGLIPPFPYLSPITPAFLIFKETRRPETHALTINPAPTLKTRSDLVPYGAIGELCVAGPQLSDGYVNNTEATNASFTGCERLGIEKMYRTGDLARWCLGSFYTEC